MKIRHYVCSKDYEAKAMICGIVSSSDAHPCPKCGAVMVEDDSGSK